MKKADAAARLTVAESNRRRAEANRRRAEKERDEHAAMVRELALSSGLKGLLMSDLVSRLCLSETAIRKHLGRLLSAGEVGRSHPAGIPCRWGAPGIYEAFAEVRAREQAAKRRTGWERLQEKAEADDWADRPIERVVLSAADAKPLGKPGPASVWDLAA